MAVLAHTNMLSDKMIELFRKQIDSVKKPSEFMRSDAKQAVREISKKIENGIMTLEVGVDEEYARSMSKEFYIRTMVTLYGNLNTSKHLYTKPNQYTWRKDVLDYHLNTFSKKVKRLRPLEQGPQSKGILSNVMKEADKYVKDWLDSLVNVFTGEYFSQFIMGG